MGFDSFSTEMVLWRFHRKSSMKSFKEQKQTSFLERHFLLRLMCHHIQCLSLLEPRPYKGPIKTNCFKCSDIVTVMFTWLCNLIEKYKYSVGAKYGQQVNICSFAVRYDRMWPSTQWHRIYTGSGNRPYVQLRSVGDFIHELRCSKFVVGLQTSNEWESEGRSNVC